MGDFEEFGEGDAEFEVYFSASHPDVGRLQRLHFSCEQDGQTA